jgi:hypothetical protein
MDIIGIAYQDKNVSGSVGNIVPSGTHVTLPIPGRATIAVVVPKLVHRGAANAHLRISLDARGHLLQQTRRPQILYLRRSDL